MHHDQDTILETSKTQGTKQDISRLTPTHGYIILTKSNLTMQEENVSKLCNHVLHWAAIGFNFLHYASDFAVLS